MTTKEKIFETSVILFSEYGIKNVSVRQIAKEVRIKESSIYNHYSSKNEIIMDIFNRFKARIFAAFPAVEEAKDMLSYMKPSDFFNMLVINYGSKINEFITRTFKIIVSEQYNNNEARKIFLEEVIEKPSKYYENVLNHMLERNLIKDCDTNLIARLFNRAHLALSIEYAHCTTQEEKNKIIKLMFENIEYFIGGLEVL